MAETVAEDLGRLFEVGFNLGVYYHLTVTPLESPALALHRRQLTGHSTRLLVTRFARRQAAPSAQDDDLLTRTATLYLWKGFLAGRDMIDEYLTSLQGRNRAVTLDIPYIQCSFVGRNAFADDRDDGATRDADDALAHEHLRLLLPDQANLDPVRARYRGRGEFLQADTLVWVRAGRGTPRESHHLLCVDLSILSVRAVAHLRDIRHPREINRALAERLRQLRAKSVFSSLSLDTGEETRKAILHQDFERYLRAFMREDRESIKVIQAASYLASFSGFLAAHGLTPSDRDVHCTAIGYTDRGVSGLSARVGGQDADDRALLLTCQKIYQEYGARTREAQSSDARTAGLARERGDVLAVIQRNARRLFAGAATGDEGEQGFIDRLVATSAADATVPVREISHTETLRDFVNSVDPVPAAIATALDLPPGLSLRDGHRALVERALAGASRYVFLAGNPGIGKTTAMAQFLRARAHAGDGFLLVYASPRTQVNLDIFDKFRRDDGAFFDDRFIGLTSTAQIIKNNNGRHTVQYLAEGAHAPFELDAVSFHDDQTVNGAAGTRRGSGVRRIADDAVTDRGGSVRGVLDSVCRGLAALLRQDVYRFLAAAISIQSYKQLSDGGDTLEHLPRIFKDACGRDGPIPAKMRALARRLPHIIVMIDEITGDDSGPALLHGMIASLRQLRLEEFGFNLKIVVADASLVGTEIITAHLANPDPEPDKIFFRKAASASARGTAALSWETCAFKDRKGHDAVVVNANSYPARSLTLTYNVFIEPIDVTEGAQGRGGRRKRDDAGVRDLAAERIVRDVVAYLGETRGSARQAIVYIQDKTRLREVITAVQEEEARGGHAFREGEGYLEIHAQISERDKAAIQARKDAVRAVFMTSSASRGLSFKQARHIFVEVPRFDIEANLMEIMQVIYRGRGGDDQVDRALTFYLADPAYYTPGDREWSLTQSVLHLLNLLILLKLCLLTRITGAGTIRADSYTVVPVGGKSVSRAGSSLHYEMSDLLRQVDKEYHRKPSNTTLRDIRDALAHTFEEMMAVMERRPTDASLLTLLREGTPDRLLRALDHGCAVLLEGRPLQKGLVSGELLIMPVESAIAIAHISQLGTVIGRWITDDARRKLWAIILATDEYPRALISGLRSFVDIVEEFLSAESTQRLTKTDQRDDLYYAAPLLAFVVRDALTGPWEPDDEEGTLIPLRTLLRGHVQALYPSGNYLPISGSYRAFPFVLFSSPDLRGIRRKMFSGRYMLMSHELNVLDMLLSQT